MAWLQEKNNFDFGLARSTLNPVEHFVWLETASALGATTKPWHCPLGLRMILRTNFG